MSLSNINSLRPSYLVVVVLAVLAGYLGTGRPPVQPAVVATVDLERVFDTLNIRAQAETEVKALHDRQMAQIEDKRAHIRMLDDQLQNTVRNSPIYAETEQQYNQAAMELAAFVEFSTRKVEKKKADTLQRLYQDIKAEVGRLAAVQGYDVVLLDDSITALNASQNEVQMLQQISARRVLYATQKIDITDQLIAWMNEQG